MKIPTIKEVADFLKEATEDMLAREQEEVTYHLALTDKVAIVVAWEPGYDPEDAKTNKYIAEDGWGINWSLRLRDSSYFTNDWDYLNEMAGITIYEGEDEDGFIGLAEEILEMADDFHYLYPSIWIKLPDGREVDLLDDAYYVSKDDELRNEKRDLTELWWYYHSWNYDSGETKETLRTWASHLAHYYGDYDEDFQQLVSVDVLTEIIFNALIKED